MVSERSEDERRSRSERSPASLGRAERSCEYKLWQDPFHPALSLLKYKEHYFCNFAVSTRFRKSMVTVKGPTPPGTGVI